jgi:hypothetical protein
MLQALVRHGALVSRAGDDRDLPSGHIGKRLEIRCPGNDDAGGFDKDGSERAVIRRAETEAGRLNAKELLHKRSSA